MWVNGMSSGKQLKKSNLKVVIIGFGSIGSKHHFYLKNRPEVAKIAILSSRSKDELPEMKLEKFEDVKKFDPDILYICNQTSKHELELSKIEKNFSKKIIIIEKPLSNNLINLDLYKLNKYFVGYNLRYHPLIDFLKNEVELSGFVKAEISVQTDLRKWRKTDYKSSYSAKSNEGGGVALDLSHEVDYCRYLFGDLDKIFSEKRKISNLEIDSDDQFSLIAQIPNEESLLNFNFSYFAQKEERSIKIFFNDKLLHCDLINSSIIEIKNGEEKLIELDAYVQELTLEEQFIDIISNDVPKAATITDGQKVLELVL